MSTSSIAITAEPLVMTKENLKPSTIDKYASLSTTFLDTGWSIAAPNATVPAGPISEYPFRAEYLSNGQTTTIGLTISINFEFDRVRMIA